MQLLELAPAGFRNLADARIELSATTVLLGDNGQGKTSLLEAIGYLATTKSFRRARPAELARHGSASFAVAGTVSQGGARRELRAIFDEGRRATFIAGAPVELAEYIESLTVVPITQAHAAIVRGGPDERRGFLDRGILGIRPPYLRSLSAFRRTLRQKNALLRAAAPDDRQLAAWNDRLAAEGAELVVRRREYVALLRAALLEVGPAFLPEAETLGLELHDVVARDPHLASRADGTPARAEVEHALRRRLESQVARERAAGQALSGPHRDDLVIELSGRDIRRFASSGQQRSALLALKLAKVQVFRERRGHPPVLLVDDVDTEIDPTRLGTFLKQVGGRAQAVLTSSKRDLFGTPPEGALFYVVKAGVLSPA